MYTVQLSVVIPKSMESPSSSVLGVAPQTLFWTIDGLGYVSMGVSTPFAALSLPQTGPGMWARRFMFANAMITPVIAFIYFYPHFSLGVLLGTPWLVTAPGSLLAVASYFRMIESAAGAHSKYERSHRRPPPDPPRFMGMSPKASKVSWQLSPRTSHAEGNWARHAAHIVSERRLSTSGAASGTKPPGSRGRRTPWSWCTPQPRAWRQ
jgi:hypothetical protein